MRPPGDMDAKTLALVGVGGAVGAILRHALSVHGPMDFPWGTLTVNLLGSLLLGGLAALVVAGGASDETMLLLGTGVLGAFTTMSAYAVDLVKLVEDGQLDIAGTYLIATLLGCPTLAYAAWKGVGSLA